MVTALPQYALIMQCHTRIDAQDRKATGYSNEQSDDSPLRRLGVTDNCGSDRP